jgi:hypothetical protein
MVCARIVISVKRNREEAWHDEDPTLGKHETV